MNSGLSEIFSENILPGTTLTLGRQRITLDEAELEAADRETKAKIRVAEGIQAQTAAPGLAEDPADRARPLRTPRPRMLGHAPTVGGSLARLDPWPGK